MTMYKLKTCKHVTLKDNETSGNEFLDGEDIDTLVAERNKAGISSDKEKIVEQLEQIVQQLNELKSDDNSAIFAVESLKEELKEESPSKPRIEKWQERAKSTISNMKIAVDFVKKTNETIDSVSSLFN